MSLFLDSAVCFGQRPLPPEQQEARTLNLAPLNLAFLIFHETPGYCDLDIVSWVLNLAFLIYNGGTEYGILNIL